MENAGIAASHSIMRRYAELTSRGAEIHTGPGNNGGDGWVVAAQLAKNGIPVRVIEAGAPKTADAIAAKSLARETAFVDPGNSPAIVVDALLGTGSKGHPTGRIAEAINSIEAARNRGAVIVALDIPSGLDATTGERDGCVTASLTLSFGTL
jgi:NAD(P)H-hydrate epimerase